MNEIPRGTFLAMVERGALIPGKDDKSFDVNFFVVQKEFPFYLEFFVRSSLNEIELWAYDEGYMSYEVLPNGLLSWTRTGKPMTDVL